MKHNTEYYVPCSEEQRAKIEALRNKRRLMQYKNKLMYPFHRISSPVFRIQD